MRHRQRIDGLQLDDDSVFDDKIGNISPNDLSSVMDRIGLFNDAMDIARNKLFDQSIPVDQFQEPMAERIRDGKSCGDDPLSKGIDFWL